MKITIYTTPNCVQCDTTKRWFDKAEVKYNTVDLSQDDQAMQMVKGMGYAAAPVVITDLDHWSGFRISKIQDTVVEYKRENKKEPPIQDITPEQGAESV